MVKRGDYVLLLKKTGGHINHEEAIEMGISAKRDVAANTVGCVEADPETRHGKLKAEFGVLGHENV